jgi:hypothetical protein
MRTSVSKERASTIVRGKDHYLHFESQESRYAFLGYSNGFNVFCKCLLGEFAILCDLEVHFVLCFVVC